MRYFRVSQNKTWESEKTGFLWSPISSKNGSNTYKSMTEVSSGDIVFHFVEGHIAAFSIAIGDCVEMDNPHSQEGWKTKGYRIDSEYFVFPRPINLANYRVSIANIIDDNSNLKQMGFTKKGGIAQKYLSEISIGLAVFFVDLIRKESDLPVSVVKQVVDIFEKVNNIEFTNEIIAVEEVQNEEQEALDAQSNNITLDFESQKEVKSQIVVSGRLTYPRDKREVIRAINKAGYACEIDPEHHTFISNNSKHQFVEAHHLIPMSFQPEFKTNLDRSDNIVSLCPNCHRKIHFGTDTDKTNLLEVLYQKKKDEMEDIIEKPLSLRKLLKYYNVTR